jgi:hypothetical protein
MPIDAVTVIDPLRSSSFLHIVGPEYDVHLSS